MLPFKQGLEYHQEKGIFSFLKGSREFDKHWEINELQELPESKVRVAEKFLEPFIIKGIDEKHLVLDAGCGDGIHLSILKDKIKENASLIGLDISRKALEISSKRADGVSLVHASVSDLPFNSESIDLVFSFGVIAYSPDPRASFKELARVLKKGGDLGLWIYPKKAGLGGIAFNIVRKLSNLFGHSFTVLIANLVVPLLYFLPTSSKMTLSNSSWKECREVVLVNIQPSQLFFPTRKEILKWFEEEGIEIFSEDMENPITLWGRKKN